MPHLPQLLTLMQNETDAHRERLAWTRQSLSHHLWQPFTRSALGSVGGVDLLREVLLLTSHSICKTRVVRRFPSFAVTHKCLLEKY